jgi:hypothetical protein
MCLAAAKGVAVASCQTLACALDITALRLKLTTYLYCPCYVLPLFLKLSCQQAHFPFS